MNSQTDIEKFNEYLTIKGYTSKTAKGFTQTVGRFLTWLQQQNIESVQVTYNDIVAYVNACRKQRVSQSTISTYTNSIKHYYNYLQHEGYIEENPVSNIKIQGIKRKTLYEILTPEELENIYQSYGENRHPERSEGTVEGTAVETKKNIPPQHLNQLARKRNKIMIGLIVYQGLRPEELARLEVQDLQLKEGKIQVQGSRKTAGRILKLEAHQIYEIMDYMNDTRKQLLAAKQNHYQISTLSNHQINRQVFISIGTSQSMNNTLAGIAKQIQEQHPKVVRLKHLRTSVITNWLKQYNLRKVQYMAGHKYVSSTEAYQNNNIDELIEDIRKYHPIG